MLVIIDAQRAFDDVEYWGVRNNPHCEDNIAALVAAWEGHGWPIVAVRHDSTSTQSPLHPDSRLHGFKPCVPASPNLLVTKTVNSAFYGEPDLEKWLRSNGHSEVAICGITTNHCCETTARMAGNVGFGVMFVLDATATFDRVDLDGRTVSADEIIRVTGANLHGEFAEVVRTEEYLGQLG